MRCRSFAAFLLFSAAASAAGSIYKVVGPDGKISYTDQPLKAAAPNVHVFKAGTARPTNAAAANKSGAAATAAEGETKETLAGSPGREGTDTPPVRPEHATMMPAVRVVLGNQVLVRESMQLCMQAQPASTARYEGAVEGWTRRNQDVVTRAEEVLASALAPAPRIQLKQGIIDRTRQALRPLREGPAPRRIAWCDAMTANIGSGKVDLASDANVIALLRARRH